MLFLGGIKRPTREQLVETYLAGTDCDPKRFPGGPAAYWSYPDDLCAAFVRERGRDFAERMMESLNARATLTLRVNSLKAEREDVREALLREGVRSEPTAWSPHGLVIGSRINLASLNQYAEGLVEVQDEGSQLAAMTANAKGGELVLDACAGAGGKSLFMAMAMGDRGKVIATDSDDRKLSILKRRAKRAARLASRSSLRMPKRSKDIAATVMP
jgi:16S rRNA (cytosine967-C5)-methyltransferase